MISKDLALRFCFLTQTGFGALGNSFLLGLYTITFLTGCRLRPIDFVLIHLAFVNDLVLLSKGIPQTMATFGFNNFLDDVGCKFVFYIHQIARDLSLSTTCLLSTSQAIIISPKNSRWITFKARISKYIVQCCFLCWTLHLLTNSIILMYMKGPKGSKNITEIKNFIYCSATFSPSINIALYVFLMSLPDIIYVGIMVCTNGYIMLILYRHHQRVLYLHGRNYTPRDSPENRATQTILLLVNMFVSFYSLNSILALLIYFRKPPSWLVHTSVFLAACFPSCSPFVLIISDSQILKYYLALCRKIKPLPQYNPDKIQLSDTVDRPDVKKS
ncbi:vomeronasal 1 receptor monDomV1R1250 [Monodelphis domestica]|uniref:Vomeronasal type-1 receptor n=1 Tax=Monodelphis domestica TaxID=13616 RepID=A0A5F8H0Z3_MONDO|nr:vomeronasal 1 receptor monDomV1R1250 [Monodelphis domestica]